MISFHKYRIRAGLLPLTLAISLILSLFCTAAILIAYYSNLLWIRTNTLNRLELNAKSAREYVLNIAPNDLKLNSTLSIDLFDEGRDSVNITKKTWGIFDWLSIEAYSGRFSYTDNYLIGYSGDNNRNMGLYVSNNSPTAVTMIGDARIVGNAWLPIKGIKAGFYNRIGFSGNQLVNGQINKSEFNLLQIREEFNQKIQNTFQLNQHLNGSKSDFSIPDKLMNSFESPLEIIYKNDPIRIRQSIKGHVAIISDSEIIVESDAKLDNIILVAPTIKFNKGFKGCAQTFATNQIIVEPLVQLNYPSALILAGKDKADIDIAERALVEGIILLSSNTIADVVIKIAPGTFINGQVISSGKIQHHGTVNGQVVCNSFVISDNSGEHINYLKDGVIDRNSLSAYYLFPGIFENDLNRPDILLNLQ